MNQTKNRPSVAVIVPFYNGSKWVERAIESIYQQTFPADEVIVVNDGSKADEQVALYALNEKYPFRIIDKPNGGQGSARNLGATVSTADYLCFLDQDDFYLPDHIEVLVRAIPKKEPRFGFAYGDCMEADGDGNIVRSSMVKEHAAHPKHSILDLLRNDMFILPSASIICRKAYNAVGGFDEQFTGYEDDDLFMRLFRKGYTHRFVDRPVYVWCIHIESTSYSVRMSRSRFRYFKKLADAFPDDSGRARFYFRDCLVPRFGRAFIVDAIKATMTNGEHREEIGSILKQYAAMVMDNPNVARRYKFKLALATFVLTSCPPAMVKSMRRLAYMPVFRRLVI
ncbi:glycosyltransferase family 2 protein [Paraburkholderia phenoliruptrix]|uniref:Glycosyltransferase family 2 protein n=1 Tax=Paraburkholderia phenoliruptrix TaxID=252970 RepID=A0ABV3WGA4_9BURK